MLQKVSATRIVFIPQKEIMCKSIHATGRNFQSFEEISCHRKKFPDTGPILLSQEEISCHGKKFAFTAKKIPVTERHFSQEIFSL